MKKIFPLLFFIIFLSFLILSWVNFALADEECGPTKPCPQGKDCVQGKCVSARALEIVYPRIPGVPTPKYVSSWLPDYINYIFRFSIILIGILIFGVLIYNGVRYLTSFGSPTNLLEAKKGILAAFLGGIILLSARLIFTTLNPELVVLEPADPELIDPRMDPGVYLCNYKYEKIGDDLQDYLTGDRETRIEAAKRIKEAMGEMGGKSKKRCYKVLTSQPLKEVDIIKNKDQHTIFIVPREDFTKPECQTEDPKNKDCWIWEYGMVFHESPEITGSKRCVLLPRPTPIPSAQENFNVYTEFSDYHHKFSFDVRSITVFKKQTTTIPELAKGLTLFEGFDYNRVGEEKKEEEKKGGWQLFPSFSPVFAREEDPNLGKKSFKPTGSSDLRRVTPDELKNIKALKKDEEKGIIGLHHNTKSIEFDPGKGEGGGYFAILFGLFGDGKGSQDSDEFFEKCEVREKDDDNLMNNPIGQCGKKCKQRESEKKIEQVECYPCLEKVYVIKGTIY